MKVYRYKCEDCLYFLDFDIAQNIKCPICGGKMNLTVIDYHETEDLKLTEYLEFDEIISLLDKPKLTADDVEDVRFDMEFFAKDNGRLKCSIN